jgi:hypothetical protein
MNAVLKLNTLITRIFREELIKRKIAMKILFNIMSAFRFASTLAMNKCLFSRIAWMSYTRILVQNSVTRNSSPALEMFSASWVFIQNSLSLKFLVEDVINYCLKWKLNESHEYFHECIIQYPFISIEFLNHNLY